MILQSKRVFVCGHLAAAQIEISGKWIRAIYPYGQKKADLDYGSCLIAPGFIDIHTHGGYDFDGGQPGLEGYESFASSLLEEGVTSFLLSMVTQSDEKLLELLKQEIPQTGHLARCLGYHLEGPFLSPSFCGAHDPALFKKADEKLVERFISCAKKPIRMITLGDADQDPDFLDFCNRHQIVCALGHSDVNFEQAFYLVANGINNITHTFNAMSPFRHRDPGLAAAAMDLPVFCEIICDGKHVDYPAVEILYRLKAPFWVIAITDALSLKGSKKNQAKLGELDVQLRNGHLYIKDSSTIAGSTHRMHRTIKNLLDHATVSLEWILYSMSENPARLLNLDTGQIRSGKKADLVVLDKDYEVLETFVEGISAYRKVVE